MSTQRNARPSGATAQASDQPAPRLFVFIALLLAIVFVIAVLAGAKVLANRQTYTPVAMGPVDAPGAQSTQCTDAVGSAPDKLADFRQVEVMEPAPEGVLAYRDSSGTELTIRCGVTLPDQYTVMSPIHQTEDTGWFEVKDATPGSSLHTWYSVTGTPEFAVTSEADTDSVVDALSEFSPLVTDANGDSEAPTANALPLVEDKKAKGSKAVCTKFANKLPEEIEGYRRLSADEAKQTLADNAKASGAERGKNVTNAERAIDTGAVIYQPKESGFEPVVIRCGVKFPSEYRPGERVTQVDSVPWFDAPALAKGSTSGRWYAIGHEQVVAVAMPQASGDGVIPAVSDAIEASMKTR